MLTTETTIQYKIKGLRFDQYGEDSIPVAIARGCLTLDNSDFEFEIIVTPIDDGQWRLIAYGLLDNCLQPPLLYEQELIKSLVNRTARLLDTINMWPNKQSNTGGAQLSLNERAIPEEFKDKVIFSFRNKLLEVPSTHWQYLWDHIERRITGDPFFDVLGFERSDVERVLPSIKEVFPDDWVRARYTAVGLVGMADKFPKDSHGWFPAYHLARTAHGAICRDPAWNYLVEIGLALEKLQDFKGVDKLKKNSSPEVQALSTMFV